jgi:hypothetical protein
LLFLGAGTSAPNQTSNGQLSGTRHITEVTVAGTYRITEVTELGPQLVKLSLELHLTNHSTESIELSSLAFHPMHPVPAGQNSASLRVQTAGSLFELPSMTSADISKDVVVSRQEYLEYRHARLLHMQATIQNADGATQTQTLMLIGEPFTRVK